MMLVCIKTCPACEVAKEKWPFLEWCYATIDEINSRVYDCYPTLLDDGIKYSGIEAIKCHLQWTM